jgi:hypothetical protein
MNVEHNVHKVHTVDVLNQIILQFGKYVFSFIIG